MRIRCIKPEFWVSESTGRVSRDARLLFIGLWSFADDSGICRGALAVLSGALFPYDPDALGLIEGWLNELVAEGMIRRYQGPDGHSYIDIPKWLLHQKIEKPSKSRLPPFTEPSPNPHRTLTDISASGSGIRDLGSGIREQGKGTNACAREASGEAAKREPDPDQTAEPAGEDLFSGDQQPQSIPDPVERTDEDEWRYRVSRLPWVRALKTINAKIGPNNWRPWEALHAAHPDLLERVKKLPPDKRWPSEAEAACSAGWTVDELFAAYPIACRKDRDEWQAMLLKEQREFIEKSLKRLAQGNKDGKPEVIYPHQVIAWLNRFCPDEPETPKEKSA